MRKQELVEEVMSSAGLDTKSQAEAAVDAVVDSITKALSRGEEVTLTGFGTFSVTHRAARQGVNPRTGDKLQIPARTVPKFKAGKGLKDAVA